EHHEHQSSSEQTLSAGNGSKTLVPDMYGAKSRDRLFCREQCSRIGMRASQNNQVERGGIMSVELETIKNSVAKLGFDASSVDPAPKGDPQVMSAGNQYSTPTDSEVERKVARLKAGKNG